MTENVKPKPENETKPKLNIKLGDDVARGTYANLGIIHNRDGEFIFDFIFVEPQRRQGQVVSRVVTNPKTVKRLIKGLTEILRVHEEQFGIVDISETGPTKGTYH